MGKDIFQKEKQDRKRLGFPEKHPFKKGPRVRALKKKPNKTPPDAALMLPSRDVI